MDYTHPLFDAEYYLANNPDVRNAGEDPFVHFMRYGAFEGRKPNGFFDPQYYLSTYPDVANAKENPLVHYVIHGVTEGRNPSSLFNTKWYLSAYPDVAISGINPLAHYLEFGIAEGRHALPPADGKTLPTERAKAEILQRGHQQPAVMYVSGLPENTSHFYRVDHQIEALNAAGISADWCSIGQINEFEHRLIFSQIVVFFRVAWDDAVASLVEKCRLAGARIVFDIDDFVFDPSVATEQNVDGLRFLKRDDLPQYFDGVRRYHLMATNSDECIATTEYLAEAFRRMGKNANIIRNGFSRKTFESSETARQSALDRKYTDTINIGYASGSMTHQRDFSAAAEAIAKILATYPATRLIIIGMLDLNEFPMLLPFNHRIEQRPLVPHHALPDEIANFDVNIAPLEVGNPFCEAKSDLKYYEAGLLHIPTIASSTAPFRAAIKHGENGMLATTTEDWLKALDSLVKDASLRARLGDNAYRHAIDVYGPLAKQRDAAAVFSGILAAQEQKVRASPEKYHQTITFVIPGMMRGSGGHNKIISLARWFADSGHTILLQFTEPTNEYPTSEDISREFEFDSRRIRVVYSEQLICPSNITFATYWKTVYNIESSRYWAGRQYHFLQDYEPYFFAMGTDYLLAINAMQKPFHKISYGPWIKRIIKQRHGLHADDIPFYFDKNIYKPNPDATRSNRKILYFARPEMPRRCFDLGIKALKAFHDKYDSEAEIILFGSYAVKDIAIPFPYTDLQVLKPLHLANLYNIATAGLVFSPTNPSMVPFEMMACGLPVIDLDVDGNAENYGGRDNVFLVGPDPDLIAKEIHAVLNDDGKRKRIAENARIYASRMDSEHEAINKLREKIIHQ
ncbi:MAG: glycosyltransferase family 4 protein [Rhizobiales bacterium]|nr:glycosyltransferase family 4 protein [Hyphomicrobiales bacterium]